jgi:ribose-phosphate pyrophosphokinase
VSPDAGGIKRAERFRQRLAIAIGKPVGAAFAEKHRGGGLVTGDLFIGDVQGKSAIIIDDLISTGSTIARTVAACRQAGATMVCVAATHGLFTSQAQAVLGDAALDELVVTNTVPPWRLRGHPIERKLVVLGIAPLFARAIHCLHSGESLQALLDS